MEAGSPGGDSGLQPDIAVFDPPENFPDLLIHPPKALYGVGCRMTLAAIATAKDRKVAWLHRAIRKGPSGPVATQLLKQIAIHRSWNFLLH